MIGVCGVHRTGKTTLAKEFAKQYSFTYLETNVSGVFAEMGLDPADSYDFSTRLMIQRRILKHLNQVYGEAQKEHDTDVITDRTPLDLLIYTYAEVNGNNLTEEQTSELLNYTQDCIELINRRFSLIIGVQPAIEVIQRVGAGSLNPAYMDHLNMLTMGLLGDERIEVKTAYIPIRTTNLQERIGALWNLYRRNFERQLDITSLSPLH